MDVWDPDARRAAPPRLCRACAAALLAGASLAAWAVLFQLGRVWGLLP